MFLLKQRRAAEDVSKCIPHDIVMDSVLTDFQQDHFGVVLGQSVVKDDFLLITQLVLAGT